MRVPACAAGTLSGVSHIRPRVPPLRTLPSPSTRLCRWYPFRGFTYPTPGVPPSPLRPPVAISRVFVPPLHESDLPHRSSSHVFFHLTSFFISCVPWQVLQKPEAPPLARRCGARAPSSPRSPGRRRCVSRLVRRWGRGLFSTPCLGVVIAEGKARKEHAQ